MDALYKGVGGWKIDASSPSIGRKRMVGPLEYCRVGPEIEAKGYREL